MCLHICLVPGHTRVRPLSTCASQAVLFIYHKHHHLHSRMTMQSLIFLWRPLKRVWWPRQVMIGRGSFRTWHIPKGEALQSARHTRAHQWGKGRGDREERKWLIHRAVIKLLINSYTGLASPQTLLSLRFVSHKVSRPFHFISYFSFISDMIIYNYNIFLHKIWVKSQKQIVLP